MILVAEEIAGNFTDSPVYVAGIGQGSGGGMHTNEDLASFGATRYAAKEAYGIGVVELEEGVRVVARINGMNNAMPEALGIGTPLKCIPNVVWYGQNTYRCTMVTVA